jgi:hypothetical protein
VEEVPEEEIAEAEGAPAPDGHDHGAVTAEDGTLAEHLAAVHGLDVPPAVSPTTAEGLHDRLHDSSKAADD